MKRLATISLLLLLSVLVAGLDGAAHNQISYTVAPSYFHGFKFHQFHIDEALRNRLGASIVGWHASWWMGLVIGLPVLAAGTLVRGTERFVRAFVAALAAVVGLTFAAGLIALGYGFATIGPDTLPPWSDATRLADPVAFARAGTMHNAAYLGAIVGTVTGLAVMVAEAVRSRRQRS